ncbi:MAG: glycosyltransferase family 4 protein, partial [Flavobacteriales bacterium]
EIQRVLDACDVLVTPSHSEGMPNVIMEGMARGLAVVATDVGAVSAVVSEENGWLIEPNDMGALQQSLQDICLMQLPELMAKRNMSLQKIAAFHWEKIGEMTAMEIQKRVAHP